MQECNKMAKEISLLNDVNLVFVNPDERTCSLYHKHFREIDGATVIKGTIDKLHRTDLVGAITEGEDTMVLPMPSAFGLYSSKLGFVNSVMRWVGYV